MFIRKLILFILILSLLALPASANNLPAREREQISSTTGAGINTHLGEEIIISQLNNEKFLPSVAFNWKHNEYLVVWQNTWGGNRDIYAWRISSRGDLLSWFAVVPAPGADTYDRAQPSVAYDPLSDRYLVVFIHDVWGNGTDWDIGGRFIPWYGPDDSLPEFPVCQWNSSQWNPVVVYGRAQEEFMVTWNNSLAGQPTYVSAARLNAYTGTVIDDFTVSSGAENRINADVAYNLHRNEYLFTWDMLAGSHDIYGLRTTGTGANLGTEFPIAGWPDDEETPSVAACKDADQYLVGWQSLVDPGNGDYDVYARYVNGDGIPETVFLVDGTTAPEIAIEVSCNQAGDQYLFAWQTMYATGYYGIWGRFAYPDTSLGDPFGFVQPGAQADRTEPAIAGGWSNYLTAWVHDRDGTAYTDIHGRITTPYITYIPFTRR